MKRVLLFMILGILLISVGFVSAIEDCVDSDGEDYFIKGTTIGSDINSETVEKEDYCVDNRMDIVDFGPGLIEFRCVDANNPGIGDFKAVNQIYVSCDYWCSGGKCLERNKVEDVVCEIDFYYEMENDASCTVEYNGMNKGCTITADNEPGNQCILPDMYILKPTPDEGYMPVPGLSGSFDGIQCEEIETSYNTNRFFVNCKNPEGLPNEDDNNDEDEEDGEDGDEEDEEDEDNNNNNEDCIPNWQCTEWDEECEDDKYQYRTCLDANKCGKEETQPFLWKYCWSTEECEPIGFRKQGKYCDANKAWINQKAEESVCENNFECSSNVCVDNKCISSSLIQKILNWLRKFFGGE